VYYYNVKHSERSDTSDLHSLTPWLPPLPRLSFSRALTMQTHYSMALWLATFTSFSALKTLSRVVLPHHHGSSSSRLSHLHWLPVHRRIQFKIALITYKTLSTDQPPYLRNLLNPYRPSRSLRSANRNLLLIPPHNTNFSRRAFSFAAPTVWNKLPTGIRDSNTLHTFKHRLKTFFTSHPS